MLRRASSLGLFVLLAAACGGGSPPPAQTAGVSPSATAPAPATTTTATPPAARRFDALSRDDFNRFAARKNLPVLWRNDANTDGAIDPDEVVSLLFYPTATAWVENGHLTDAFATAYDAIVAASKETAPAGLSADEAERRRLVALDLDQGRPTLVETDLRNGTAGEKEFVRHMLAATHAIDAIYATQTGAAALASQVPEGDTASQSMFRRNWGPKCLAPKTENEPKCSAIPGAPRPIVDVYPASLQSDPHFCEPLEKRADASALLGHFTAVREKADKTLEAVPYSTAYADRMKVVADELRAASAQLGADEAPLKTYLEAAAQSFTNNDWLPADEAWAKMNAQNSKWYVRIGADEDYWDPCAHKAGFHVTFARINADSLAWQNKLAPLEQDMEKALGTLIGAPYAPRKVAFHLPDFIDIVWNGGDDRGALGGTIGESLPNWGKVAEEGRGRTVAMSNLFTDADSKRIRKAAADSLLSKETAAMYDENMGASLAKTILHEATHNLGPTNEYKYQGKKDEEAFGGGLASMLEELKAETGAMWFTDWMRQKGLFTDAQAKQAYTDGVVWAFGHVSRGMWTESHSRKAYSQLAAIQLGFLIDEGALTWDPNATAANGTDKGAFTIHFEKMPAAAEKLMKLVGHVKAANDRKTAEQWSARYVDGTVVPQQAITERFLRSPRGSLVYAVEL